MSAIDAITLTAPTVYDPTRLTWTAAALAWGLAVPLYAATKYLGVIAHEGGHALTGVLLLQRLTRIQFTSDGGGATEFAPPVPWLFEVVMLLAGYLGPSAFGLAGARAFVTGHVDLVLWGSLAFLTLMILTVRGLLGWLLIPTLMVLLYQIAVHAHPPHREIYTATWVWFLLIFAVERMLVVLQSGSYQDPKSDMGRLEKLTLIPRWFWALVMLAGTIATLVYGGGMLLRQAG